MLRKTTVIVNHGRMFSRRNHELIRLPVPRYRKDRLWFLGKRCWQFAEPLRSFGKQSLHLWDIGPGTTTMRNKDRWQSCVFHKCRASSFHYLDLVKLALF